MAVRVSLTERVSIEAHGAVVDEQRFPGRQGRLVFAYLLAEQGRPVPRGELAEALWGDTPPATWEKALSVVVSKLRSLLNECGLDGSRSLTSAFGCYQLTLPAGAWIDVVAADEAASAAERSLSAGDLEQARADAAIADSLARRTFLPGEDSRWVEEKRAELRETLVRALDCLAEAQRLAGDPRAAVRAAEEVIELEPFRERGYRLLMEAQSAAGNDAEALRVYERCRRLLADELGAYPSPETDSIYRGLLEAPANRTRMATASEPPAPAPAHVVDLEHEPEPASGARWTSRKGVGSAVVTLTVTAAIVAGILSTRGGEIQATLVAANAVGVIDSTSGKIMSEIPVGQSPGEIAVGAGAVWVTNANDDTVSRIDPSTNDVRQTINVGDGPAGIAVGEGAVWVANGLDGTVSRVDPTTNGVVQTIPVGNGPSGVAFGEGAVWVTNSADGTVSRIAPATGRVTKTFPAVAGASGVAVGFGRIWVASPSAATVVALDPRSGRVLSRIGVGVEPDAVAVGADSLWVANRAGGTVSRIDPRAVAVKSTVTVGREPDGIAAGTEGVWVANGGDGTLSRIDASRAVVVTTVPLENSPRSVALTEHGLYVAVRSTWSEHRGGELRVQALEAPDSLDPALAYSYASGSILTMTNDGLVGFRKVAGVEGTQLVPDLAVALPTPTEGGKTYTFEVRPDIRYSDGKLVQPDDFRRALERVFELESPGAVYYAGIVGANGCTKGKRCDLSGGIATDRAARTVTFRLSARDADFLTKLAMPFAYAVPAGTPGREVGSRPIPATGPYRIAAYRKTQTLRLVRNRAFRKWSADAQPEGFPASISFSWSIPFAETAARAGAVARGTADVAPGGGPPLPEREVDALAVRYPGRLHVSTEPSTVYFFLNTRVAPFADVRVRRAFSIAFDREALARAVGRAGVPTCRIIPRNFPGYRPTCSSPATGGVANLDRARRVVASSGAVGTRVTVWMPDRAPRKVGRYVVSLLTSLGFRAGLQVEPIRGNPAYFDKVSDSRTGAQIGWAAWGADYPSAGGIIAPLLSCAAFVPASAAQNTNLAGFCDRSIDAQMSRASAAQVQDPAAGTILWQQIEDAVLAQAPIVPAYNRSYVTFVSERVGNYQYNPQWGVLLNQLWVR